MSGEAPGSARLVLARNVVHLDPAPAVFEGMLEGWARQQAAQLLREGTIRPRLRLVRRMVEFSGLYPWQWTPEEGEAFIGHLRGQRGGLKGIELSTARGYEVTITLFVSYLLDRRYGWDGVCTERFGQGPREVFHEGNSVAHTVEFEGNPSRRPLAYDELQALFDAADSRPGRIRGLGRKGALCALRDAAVLDLHCLRYSYISHLVEFGYPLRFVQEQVGHSHGSTTAIYTVVSNEYRNTLLEASMKKRLDTCWDVAP
ncbi:tyrosine-type recombinase/integrase [Streptomyces sp. MB09-01]|nr:tyrosine-type recombinase/integrase [Streptomyces sp. MB09-01]MDX3537533.1 tyrosine-type recombinase/integrase [Streptomyces sp. MB09-01]